MTAYEQNFQESNNCFQFTRKDASGDLQYILEPQRSSNTSEELEDPAG